MKTLIVGTGYSGVICGSALSEAGVDVTRIVIKCKTDRFTKGSLTTHWWRIRDC